MISGQKNEEAMKIRLYFDKGNLGRLAIAMILASVLYAGIGFSVWALLGFGALYFLIKSLKIELSGKLSWLWTGLMLVGSSFFTAYQVQYLLLDAELRAKITDTKMFLNVLCCLTVFLLVQACTNQAVLTCMISYLFLKPSLCTINGSVWWAN